MRFTNIVAGAPTLRGQEHGQHFEIHYDVLLIVEAMKRGVEFDDLIDSKDPVLINSIKYSSLSAKNLMLRRALNFLFPT